jgi:hypothetical protein
MPTCRAQRASAAGFRFSRACIRCAEVLAAAVPLVLGPAARADTSADHPGAAIYREHCVRCHGADGTGTAEVPHPLVGDRSIGQLAAYIDETMPEDDPTRVTGADARLVAEFIHAAFYATPARHDDRPPRVELSRLTVRQHRNSLADLVGGFREAAPVDDGTRGLRGEYFRGRDTDRRALEADRIDQQVAFDFGFESPDPERFEPSRFTIRWTGSVLPPETGVYEFVVRATDAVKFSINTAAYEPPLVDATVSLIDDVVEHRLALPLLGGRAYPLRLEFSKANQGVNDARHERPSRARIALSWRPPHGVLEPVPARCLLPRVGPPVFVPCTPFPPDDRSMGYERGSSVSPEWLAAATAAAAETADHVLGHVARPDGAAARVRGGVRRAGLPPAALLRPAPNGGRPPLRRSPRPRHRTQAVDHARLGLGAVSVPRGGCRRGGRRIRHRRPALLGPLGLAARQAAGGCRGGRTARHGGAGASRG